MNWIEMGSSRPRFPALSPYAPLRDADFDGFLGTILNICYRNKYIPEPEPADGFKHSIQFSRHCRDCVNVLHRERSALQEVSEHSGENCSISATLSSQVFYPPNLHQKQKYKD